MARPAFIQDDLVLAVAHELFLKRGMRVTTAEIAEAAQVSQGSIFKRFKSKQALFRAAMDIQFDPLRPLPIDLHERAGQGEVETTLNDLGLLLLDKFMGMIPTIMMSWSNAQYDEDCTSHFIEKAPERAAKSAASLADYLQAEAGLGRIRPGDYEVISRTFIGALWHYAFLQVMLGEVHKQAMTRQDYVCGVVNTIWAGIKPQ